MIKCPKCNTHLALDETLAGPMIAKIRDEADAKIRNWEKAQDEQLEKDRKAAEALAAKEKEISEREASLQTQVNLALAKERTRIAEEERANARKEIEPERQAELARVKELEEKLTKAQQEELKLRNEKSALETRAKELDLEVARKVDDERKEIPSRGPKRAPARGINKLSGRRRSARRPRRWC